MISVIKDAERAIILFLFFAHNQFRFDFFLFLRNDSNFFLFFWEMTAIEIGGKNTTDKNFAII